MCVVNAYQFLPGDCLDHLRGMGGATVDLAYLDPPYNTGVRRVGTDRGNGVTTYTDNWSDMRDYVAFLRERVAEVHRVLRPTGSILLHCDWRSSHHVRLMLDDIFGAEAFVNHIVWSYGLGGSSPRRFARKHDDILFYGRSAAYWFEPPRVPARSVRLAGQLKKATDVLDIPSINNMALERTGYPTQKPLELLRVLVGACCPPGGLVLDPFCGSGTTLVAAVSLGRSAIGIDVNDDALRLARARLESTEVSSSRTPSRAPDDARPAPAMQTTPR